MVRDNNATMSNLQKNIVNELLFHLYLDLHTHTHTHILLGYVLRVPVCRYTERH